MAANEAVIAAAARNAAEIEAAKTAEAKLIVDYGKDKLVSPRSLPNGNHDTGVETAEVKWNKAIDDIKSQQAAFKEMTAE